MQGLKRGVGLFVFLGLAAQAAAQDIPEQARKQIRITCRAPSWCSATPCRRT